MNEKLRRCALRDGMFLMLHDQYGQCHPVRVQDISAFRTDPFDDTRYTTLFMTGGQVLVVREPVDEIARLLGLEDSP